jgi:hypothetical protein
LIPTDFPDFFVLLPDLSQPLSQKVANRLKWEPAGAASMIESTYPATHHISSLWQHNANLIYLIIIFLYFVLLFIIYFYPLNPYLFIQLSFCFS